jgi:heme-degrading monooxygenase HmoA
MNTTIAVTKQVTTLINILTVEPENQQKLIKLLRDNTESVVSRLDGWISTSFIAATDQRHVVIYSQWRDLESVEAMQTNSDMVARDSIASQPNAPVTNVLPPEQARLFAYSQLRHGVFGCFRTARGT